MNHFPDHRIYLHPNDEGATMFTINPDELQSALTSSHATSVVIEWQYGEGMPNTEMNLLLEILDISLKPLRESAENVVTHTTLGNGCREICFYTTNYDQFMEDINSCLDKLPRLPIQILNDSDPDWKYAKQMREMIQEGLQYAIVENQLQRVA